MTNNPLIAKWEELYGKKEKPKLPKIEDYEGEKTIADELKEKRFISTSNASVSIKPKPLTSYDPHSTEDSFLQVAELVKQNKAKITSMSMSVDTSGLFMKTISFEVQVADWDTP